ncbi:hypothetical protein [Coleofasciculus sp. G2-EDA-02]
MEIYRQGVGAHGDAPVQVVGMPVVLSGEEVLPGLGYVNIN